MPHRRQALAAAIAAQFFFASTSIVGKYALQTFTPLALMILRVVGAAAIFWAIAPRNAFRMPFTRRELGWVALCGVLGLILNQGLFLAGLSLSTAIDATVINTAMPVFTVAIAMAIGDEHFSLKKTAGIALALLGAMALAGLDDLERVSIGDLLFVANSLAFAAYLVLVRRLAKRFDAWTLSRWTFAFAACLALPLAGFGPLLHKPPNAWAVAEGVWLVLGPTVLAYGLGAYALEKLESSTVASFNYLQPPIAAAMAIPLLHERPGPRTGIGTLLISPAFCSQAAVKNQEFLPPLGIELLPPLAKRATTDEAAGVLESALNDLGLVELERELGDRYGATPAEVRKVFAGLHAPRKPLSMGAELGALAETRAVRRTVLNGLLGDGRLGRLKVVGRVTSPRDGFQRYLFETSDGERIEAVRIPIPCETGETPVPQELKEKPHYVVCVSSQAGCALACAFCATGKLGFRRNLQVHEIVEQVRWIRAEADRPVRGIVFMGMGEPMLNYERVMTAARIFSAPAGYAIAADRITISTAGVVPGIRRFTAERQPYRLAVSLTAATSEKRRQVMPIEATWPLPELMSAVREHQAAFGQRSMLAWVAIEGFNTGAEDAAELRALTEGLPLRLDLIDVADPTGAFRPPDEAGLRAFRSHLQVLGQPVVRRYSGGRDIDAGCGMLAARPVP